MLTPEQQNTINQGSINAANANNIKAGIVSTPTIPTTLNSTNTASNPSFIVPPIPKDSANYPGMIANGNATIGANNTYLTPNGTKVDAQGNVITPAPVQTDTSTNTGTFGSIKDYINNYLGIKPPSASSQDNTDYNASGIDTKKADFNQKQQALLDAQSKYKGIDAKLQGINAEATAIPIRDQQNAEGRGITAAGLAPITAGELRMNALKAIPLQAEALTAQAEVAAAQGNAQLSQAILQQAQDHLDKIFQIHQTDATNAYNYQKDLIDKAYQFADKQETKQLDAQKATLATNNTQYNNFVNDIRTAASSATSALQGDVAAKLSALVTTIDPTSKTFAQDYQKAQSTFATLQGQIKPKVTTSSTPISTGGSVTGLTSEQSKILANKGLSSIQAENVAGIFNGTRPPLSGLGSNSKEGQAVTAGLNALGYNLTKATEDWTAMQKRISTLNGQQQIRLQQAVSFSADSLDIIDQLNTQWQGGRFPILNKASLALAKEGAYGADAQSLATRFEAQIGDLVSELGTVYKGGNSSTDESLKLAANNLSSNWSQKTLTDAINLVRTNLQIRKNSMANSAVIEGNQYSTSTTAPTADQHSSYQDYLKAIGL